MTRDPLRVAAFCAYLAAWVVFAVGAVVSGLPQIRKQAASPGPLRIHPATAVGTVLQIASAMVVTFFLGSGPLRPMRIELMGALVLAPLAAALFAWAVISASQRGGADKLVTRGAYAWIRHPMYLAFLGMLIATGLLASSVIRLAIAIVMYLAGSELRIASEERTLAVNFGSEYEQYRLRTRWRYLPGLR
jgi:protein-S-isoprenylcysteine O-methyltransferase Ste14